MARLNKVSFYLARPKDKARTVVLVRLRIGREQLRFGTGISVYPKDWNPKAQRMKRNTANEVAVNDRLTRIESDLTGIFLDLRNNRIEPTPERVKSRYDALINRDATATGEKSFLDYVRDWIEESNVKEDTKKTYRQLKNHLEAFSNKRGRTLSFDGMDQSFVNEFRRYLQEVAQLGKSTIGKIETKWKTFMTWAVDRGLTTNEYFRGVPKVKAPHSIPQRLNPDEFKRLRDYDLSDNPKLANVRDLFLILCLTGMRVGDLSRLLEWAKEDRTGSEGSFQYEQEKTGKTVIAPLRSTAQEILNRGTVRLISEQKINTYLKELAELAGLNRMIQFRGRQQPIHSCISTHWGKKTFVSLAASEGINREAIRAAVGNSNATMEKHYMTLNHDDVEKAFELADSVFS